MKQLNKLTQAEQAELVSYTSPSTGTIIYYNLLTTIASGSIVYNGDHLDVLDGTMLDELKAGKAKYEAYKLFYMKSDAELQAKEQTMEAIKEYFEQDVQTIVDSFSGMYSKLKTELSTAATDIQSSVRNLKQADKAVEETNLQNLADKLGIEIVSLKNAKHKFNGLSSELEKLFTGK